MKPRIKILHLLVHQLSQFLSREIKQSHAFISHFSRIQNDLREISDVILQCRCCIMLLRICWLTHIINLDKVVAVMTIVDAFDTDCQRTRFTEVFHRLIFVKFAWDKIHEFDSSRISYQAQHFVIDFEIFSHVIISYGCLAKRTLFYFCLRVFQDVLNALCTYSVSTVGKNCWKASFLIKGLFANIASYNYSVAFSFIHFFFYFN